MSFTEILWLILIAVPVAAIFLAGWVVGFGTNYILKLLKKDDSDFEGI